MTNKTANLFFQLVVRKKDKKPRYFRVQKIEGTTMKNCLANLEQKLRKISKNKKILLVKDFNKFEKRFKLLKTKKSSYSVELIKFIQFL